MSMIGKLFQKFHKRDQEKYKKEFFDILIQMFPTHKHENSWERALLDSLMVAISTRPPFIISDEEESKLKSIKNRFLQWQDNREHFTAMTEMETVEIQDEEARKKFEKEREELVLWKETSERSELESIFYSQERKNSVAAVLEILKMLKEKELEILKDGKARYKSSMDIEYIDKYGEGKEFFEKAKRLTVVNHELDEEDERQKRKRKGESGHLGALETGETGTHQKSVEVEKNGDEEDLKTWMDTWAFWAVGLGAGLSLAAGSAYAQDVEKAKTFPSSDLKSVTLHGYEPPRPAFFKNLPQNRFTDRAERHIKVGL